MSYGPSRDRLRLDRAQHVLGFRGEGHVIEARWCVAGSGYVGVNLRLTERRRLMGIKRVVPDITCDAIEESRDFYSGVLGFDVAMDMGWIVTLSSPEVPSAQISLVSGTEDAAKPIPDQ